MNMGNWLAFSPHLTEIKSSQIKHISINKLFPQKQNLSTLRKYKSKPIDLDKQKMKGNSFQTVFLPAICDCAIFSTKFYMVNNTDEAIYMC